ncbi:kelch domain-containing protein 1 isoform X6 [Narcine bancroftii]|uniref:kelch domain-containing protein 1 isoform X6 n=1 Tax=Narcine bancroftii TaxID=1343680 RepID=UPI003831BB92
MRQPSTRWHDQEPAYCKLLPRPRQIRASRPSVSTTSPGEHKPTYENNEVYLPNDEIWVYEIESGIWQRQPMKGDLPRPMSGSCAACLNGVMYIFGGYDDLGYSNELYSVNLQVKNDVFTWKKICNYEGSPPTPRDKLSCWVHKDKLIYFGGYGCKKINELNDSFDVNEASWEEEMFWGWNYDIHVFDPNMNIWYQPIIKGISPRPRAAHACATLGNKGYLFGGRILETRINDLHCLDLDTWTWSGEITVKGIRPQGRSWHTLTSVTDDQLFLFGGLSAESQPLSDAWIYSVGISEWRQLEHCPKNRPRLCLDCIAKNSTVLQNHLPWLPRQLLSQVEKKITFWVSARRQEK